MQELRKRARECLQYKHHIQLLKDNTDHQVTGARDVTHLSWWWRHRRRHCVAVTLTYTHLSATRRRLCLRFFTRRHRQTTVVITTSPSPPSTCRHVWRQHPLVSMETPWRITCSSSNYSAVRRSQYTNCSVFTARWCHLQRVTPAHRSCSTVVVLLVGTRRRWPAPATDNRHSSSLPHTTHRRLHRRQHRYRCPTSTRHQYSRRRHRRCCRDLHHVTAHRHYLGHRVRHRRPTCRNWRLRMCTGRRRHIATRTMFYSATSNLTSLELLQPRAPSATNTSLITVRIHQLWCSYNVYFLLNISIISNHSPPFICRDLASVRYIAIVREMLV